jgi:hypothetical protein
MTCMSITICSKDHHDENYRWLIKSSDYPNGKIEGLILKKCYDQELQNLAMLEEVLIEI